MTSFPSPNCNSVQPPRASAAPKSHHSPQEPVQPPPASADPVFLSDSSARGFLSPATAKAQQEKNHSKAQLAPSTLPRMVTALLHHSRKPWAVTAPEPLSQQQPGAELPQSCDLATTKRAQISQNSFVPKPVQALPSPLCVKKAQPSPGSSLGLSQA